MPTVSEVLGGVLENALAHPKSTIQSVLTCLMVGVPCLLTSGVIHGKTAGIAGAVLAVVKVYVGAGQTDGITIPPNSTVTGNVKIQTPPSAE